MLTAVKNEFRVLMQTFKYNIMREMVNRGTFLLSTVMMILNDASFIIQWIILFTVKDNYGGYDMSSVMLLWGLAASSFGLASMFFHNAMFLSDYIVEGKLDSLLVQPKNVLLASISQKCEASAFGDLIYGYIMLFISGFTFKKFLLFTFFSITGCILITAFRVIVHSSSFFFGKIDLFVDNVAGWITQFSTYPDIFRGIVKVLLYTVVPIALCAYLPISIMNEFNLKLFLGVIGGTIIFIILAIFIFYKGLKRYSSSNLFSARI